MDIRTKVITTIIAMVCSVSVSATGIVAILLDFPVSVSNTSVIAASDVAGNLYGQRLGADDYDTPVIHLYKSGSGIDQTAMAEFTEDVNFTPGSNKMEYIFKFVLDSDAESGVFISLTEGTVTDSSGYKDEYLVAYGKEEPNWQNAEAISINKTYVVDSSTPYIWLKATLKRSGGAYQRLDASAKWAFCFNFEGVAEQTA